MNSRSQGEIQEQDDEHMKERETDEGASNLALVWRSSHFFPHLDQLAAFLFELGRWISALYAEL